MNNKLYAVVMDNSLICDDLINGGLAVYEFRKDAKLNLNKFIMSQKEKH